MRASSEVDPCSEAVPDLSLLQLLMGGFNVLSACVSQSTSSVLEPFTQVWSNYMNFVCFVELEPAPVQEHEQTVELGYMLAPVGVEVDSNGDVVEVADWPQVGGNQRADVCWEDGL